MFFFFLIRLPPGVTRHDILLHYTTLFRSSPAATRRQSLQVSLPSPNGGGKLLCQLHLFEIEFDRGCPPEDRDRNLDAILFEIQFLDRAVEAGERTVQNLDLITDLVIDVDLVLGLSRSFLFGIEDARRFSLADRLRLTRSPQKARTQIGRASGRERGC